MISTSEAERMLRTVRAVLYEHGEKAGRLLANCLKGRRAGQMIAQIRNTANQITSDPHKINNTFMTFYSSLYKSDSSLNDSSMSHFFDNIEIPRLSDQERTALVTLNEISRAIKSMNSGKSPGPDGFLVEFYKQFSTKLAPLLLHMYNDCFEQGILPPSRRQATISLIYEQGKDPDSCSSYRPISLLNIDVKILAKIFAFRLETVIHNIISEDQTGFIRNWHSFTNVCRLLNILFSPSTVPIPEALISLDAEKAFDRVEWPYLLLTLKKFGSGDHFTSWIRQSKK